MEWTIVNYDSLMDNIKRIHFIGIGGSGMCPLAEILHHEGYELSGSDMNEGETLDRIKGYGIPVFMGHAAENIKGAELVVYSAAIKETNPERQAAKELGIQKKYCGFGYTRQNNYNSYAFTGAYRQRF